MFSTADAADGFVRRQALWARLRAIFDEERPTEEQLGQVRTLAEIAIDSVFGAHTLTPEQQATKHGEVADYAECAALYSFALGFAQGRQAALAQSMGAPSVSGD